MLNLFYVALFSCCTIFKLLFLYCTLFMLDFASFYTFFSYCTIFMLLFFVLPSLHTTLFSCSIFSHCSSFVLHCFHAALFLFLITLYSYCTSSMLHLSHIALFSYCFVCIALFHAGLLSCCTFSVLHSLFLSQFFCVAPFSECTLSRYTVFMLPFSRIAIYLVVLSSCYISSFFNEES